jgi:hypothetical protein
MIVQTFNKAILLAQLTTSYIRLARTLQEPMDRTSDAEHRVTGWAGSNYLLHAEMADRIEKAKAERRCRTSSDRSFGHLAHETN